MSRKAEMTGGRIVSFWMGSEHERALEAFRVRNGLRSRGAALRAVLEVVGRLEGLKDGNGSQNDQDRRSDP